jgi:CBS domain-containing membrane protein
VAIQKSLALPWVWGAPLAAGIAVALMLVTRSLHPPGGAVAVLAVLSGADWSFAAHPVATNTVLLLAAATLFNRATGRRYPHDLHARPPVAPQGVPARFSDADLDKALQRYNQIIDVPRDDLRSLLEQAEMEAHARRIRQWRCADIMTPDPTSVGHHTPLAEAWTLMHTRRIKALPVVDRSHRVVGIVTRADFLRAADLRSLAGLDDRLRRLLRPPEAIRSEAAQVVGQIMTREVRVTQAERSLADLLPVFSSTGHHHLPVIDSELRLVGILTQTDVVRALMREASPAG